MFIQALYFPKTLHSLTSLSPLTRQPGIEKRKPFPLFFFSAVSHSFLLDVLLQLACPTPPFAGHRSCRRQMPPVHDYSPLFLLSPEARRQPLGSDALVVLSEPCPCSLLYVASLFFPCPGNQQSAADRRPTTHHRSRLLHRPLLTIALCSFHSKMSRVAFPLRLLCFTDDPHYPSTPSPTSTISVRRHHHLNPLSCLIDLIVWEGENLNPMALNFVSFWLINLMFYANSKLKLCWE